jgi:hypothetical protein
MHNRHPPEMPERLEHLGLVQALYHLRLWRRLIMSPRAALHVLGYSSFREIHFTAQVARHQATLDRRVFSHSTNASEK